MGAQAAWDPARPGSAVAVGESCWSVELAAEVLRRLGDGERLSAICDQPGMPDRGTVRAWEAKEPGFSSELRRRMRLLQHMAGEVQRAEALEKRRRREERGWWWDPLESTCRHASLSIL